MKASRKRPKGAYRWSFGLLLCSSVLMPTSIGYQDLAALIARQPAVTERWRAHVRNSAFSTIHATFSFPRPVGSSIPDPYFTQLASLDPRALDVTGSVPLPAPLEPQAAAPNYDFPVVQRRLKGDRLPLATSPQPPAAPAKEPASQPQKLKDQASLTPGPKPEPLPAGPETAADPQQPPAPVARKGDRTSPVPVQADAALQRAADSAQQAAKVGCRGLMVLPAYVHKGERREAETHVAAVISATPLPSMLYNNPPAYGTDFTPECVESLAARLDRLVAVKESSGDARRVTAIRALCGDRLDLCVGMDDMVVEGVAAGATGWVAGLVNALPRESVVLFEQAQRGSSHAAELYRWFLPLLRLDTVPEFVQWIKLVQQECGLGHERVRPPRLVLEGAMRDKGLKLIRAALAARPRGLS